MNDIKFKEVKLSKKYEDYLQSKYPHLSINELKQIILSSPIKKEYIKNDSCLLHSSLSHLVPPKLIVYVDVSEDIQNKYKVDSKIEVLYFIGDEHSIQYYFE